MKKYITYGFVTDNIHGIKTDLTNNFLNKPKQALWGSPVDADFGWIDWCEGEGWWPDKHGQDTWEDYISHSFTWTLKEGSRVYEIWSAEDLEKMFQEGFIEIEDKDTYGIFARPLINFQKLKDAGYTAVELCNSCIGHLFLNKLEESMNSWDCESIVVLDPDKVELVD